MPDQGSMLYTLGDLQQDLLDLLSKIKRGGGNLRWFALELHDIANALDISDMEVNSD